MLRRTNKSSAAAQYEQAVDGTDGDIFLSLIPGEGCIHETERERERETGKMVAHIKQEKRWKNQ